jgi:cardiolipin synthase (CMP-forming)
VEVRAQTRPQAAVSTRVLTIPNLLSLIRLAGVPLFLWLVLVPKADGWALAVLMVSGVTDYVDGVLARRWNQITRVGQLLDPLADRLYIVAVLVGLTLREIIPLWLTALIVARDLVLVLCYPSLRRHGYGVLPVNYLGKAATFNLLYAFPLLLLGEGTGSVATLAEIFGWAFAIWGTGLYWWAGVLYVVQTRQLVRGSSGSGPRSNPRTNPRARRLAEQTADETVR